MKTYDISKESKAVLDILISEIQICNSIDEVNQVLNLWIKANDLHPEKVEILTKEEFIARMK